jgi:hypothetical protein
VDWEVVEIDGAHEPILTRPEKVAEAVVGAMKKWSGA